MANSIPMYPSAVACLSNVDGNAFSILGETRRALRAAGVDQSKIQQFTDEASSGSYDDLLQTVMRWVEVV